MELKQTNVQSWCRADVFINNIDSFIIFSPLSFISTGYLNDISLPKFHNKGRYSFD